MEDGEVGSSSRRVSLEFTNTCNISEQKSQLEGPNRRISFTIISKNGGVMSVRKVNKIPSVHTHTSVGPKVPIVSHLSSNVQTERENKLLAETTANRKRGRVEFDDGS